METFNFEQYQNIVIKVGSALIAPDGMSCSTQYCLPLANFIKKCESLEKRITLVSSGAVAAGFNTLRPQNDTLSLDEKQALAAVGQSKVINHWQRFFDNHVAQVLLTAADMQNHSRSANAHRTLNTLHQHRVLPIVNENDTVAIEELKFGDNDRLAAQVACLINADLLIICSDVDGVFTDNPHLNPQAKLINTIDTIDESVLSLGQNSHNPQATGGMLTKLLAAQLAQNHGIDTVICNGKTEAYLPLLQDQCAGTWVVSDKPLDRENAARIRNTYP
ncbi:glutamate 5-kinase [Kangiella taiwanensis]|uniref:Glutamate 5-kinase n=1 Tax=Kangiella taiwanensis TaxID=1079179 RepID=A0ABP8I6S8_9GAMM|nr:glutamate 5-kinase [Kangiella taiwanensis]